MHSLWKAASSGIPAMTGPHIGTSNCAVCGNSSIDIVESFATLPRATSDCRPFPAGGQLGICRACHTVQKPADPQWQADAAAIYDRYEIFRQAACGAEQRVFDPTSGTSLPRSDTVLQRLQSTWPLSTSGRALDVGCGNGPTLSALSNLVPKWRLFGHEISDTNLSRLMMIPGFECLYVGDLAQVEGQFDLITMFHSLEHLPAPVAGLTALRGKLAPGGLFVVEVPNVVANVFDLVVADHRCHFDPQSLVTTVQNAGWPHVVAFDDWAVKELTLLASDTPLRSSAMSATSTPLELADLRQRVEWLAALLQAATQVANDATTFGLFGTAIAATWLFGPLADHVAFFVDDDLARIGQQHEGRPILAPAEVPAGSSVFIPLVPGVAERVAARLSTLGVRTHLPPKPSF